MSLYVRLPHLDTAGAAYVKDTVCVFTCGLEDILSVHSLLPGKNLTAIHFAAYVDPQLCVLGSGHFAGSPWTEGESFRGAGCRMFGEM